MKNCKGNTKRSDSKKGCTRNSKNLESRAKKNDPKVVNIVNRLIGGIDTDGVCWTQK